MLIYNAKLYPMAQPVIENGYVLFDKTIQEIGPMTRCPGKAGGLDAGGASVLPGFVDAHTHLGLYGDAVGTPGDDLNEMTNPCTPQLRAIDAINVHDHSFAEALRAGVTTVLSGPGSANPIAGQIAALKTYGKNIADMTLLAPAAMKFALGENPKRIYKGKNAEPSTRMATAAIIREQLERARQYAAKKESGESLTYDTKLEALSLLFTQKLPAHFHAHRADDIQTAMRLAAEFDLNLVLVHCTQGAGIAQELANRQGKALCGPLLADRSKVELAGATPATPGLLQQAGVQTAIITDHPEIPQQYLPLCAGLAVRAGMHYEEALKAITLYPAQIVGLAERVGALAPGLDADLLLFDGDPLDVYTTPRQVFAAGVPVL